MDRSTRMMLIGLLIGILIGLLLFLPTSVPSNAIPSANGRYYLVPYRNGATENLAFTVMDEQGAELFDTDTGASYGLSWKLGWDEQERVWLNSADIGIWYWEPAADDVWNGPIWRGDRLLPDSVRMDPPDLTPPLSE